MWRGSFKLWFLALILVIVTVLVLVVQYSNHNRSSASNSGVMKWRPRPHGPWNASLEKSKQGFLMALDYSDQMTGSAANLMNLQCFVGHHVQSLKVVVVEPFIHYKGSLLGVSLSTSYTMSQPGYKLQPKELNSVKLRDIFNFRDWQIYAKSKGYSPLVSWNNFISNSPKKLVLAFHSYHESEQCNPTMMVKATKEFVHEHNFEEIRNVCINFRKTGVLSPQDFLHKLYGPFKPSETVVVFNRWGGIEHSVSNYRYAINAPSCRRGHEKFAFHHSEQISKDFKEYSLRYMNNTEKYVAVMVRLERFALNNNFNNLPMEAQRTKLKHCFSEIITNVRTLKEENPLYGQLLTMDIGKYGSTEFKLKGTRGYSGIYWSVLDETVHDFFNLFFNHSMTQNVWEESFEKVAKFHVPGYIALMQKELAANSACLILAGGGSFQNNAKKLYDEFHHSSRTKCVFHKC